ncbi:MAG: serine/threonine-protein kinase [Terriglobia bacterium]|jgi:serine/threonine-protein kinase
MSDEQAVQRIGDYEILAVLGAGGMGKVYKVRNVFTDRIEAMKIVLPDLAGQNEVVERFLREIKVLARLDHPNIAALRTAQTVENQLVMVMEFVEGSSLSARVTQGPIPPLEAINYVDQVLAALAYAHQQHIIHRDIKPANMMLTPEGVVKLMDFGIARSTEDRALTMAGTSLGSLPYMSPEQITGTDIDGRADLYSVGVSLYEMVTATKPFQADSNYAMMVAHLQNAPRPPIELQPGLPAELNQVILMALAKEPGERFQTADAFRNALQAVSESLGGKPSPVASALPLSADAARAAFQESSAGGTVAAGPVVPLAQPPVQPPAPPTPTPAAPAANQSWTPADSVLPPPGVERPSSYRGLYMTLGALIVVAVLVVAGIYGPRWARARAGGGNSAGISQPTSQPASPATQPSSPAGSAPNAAPASTTTANASQAAPAATPLATGLPSGQPASELSASQPQPSSPPSTPPATSAAVSNASAAHTQPPQTSSKKASGRVSGGAQPASSGSWNSDTQAQQAQQPQVAPQSTSGPSSQAEAASAAELEELENQMDQLSTRAVAAKESVETIRRQQQAQGLNLRGDISAAEDLMATYMDKAKAALQNKNAKDARKYIDKAEIPLGTLEKFLGRR